jgi:hypothetical protein
MICACLSLCTGGANRIKLFAITVLGSSYIIIQYVIGTVKLILIPSLYCLHLLFTGTTGTGKLIVIVICIPVYVLFPVISHTEI